MPASAGNARYNPRVRLCISLSRRYICFVEFDQAPTPPFDTRNPFVPVPTGCKPSLPIRSQQWQTASRRPARQYKMGASLSRCAGGNRQRPGRCRPAIGRSTPASASRCDDLPLAVDVAPRRAHQHNANQQRPQPELKPAASWLLRLSGVGLLVHLE